MLCVGDERPSVGMCGEIDVVDEEVEDDDEDESEDED